MGSNDGNERASLTRLSLLLANVRELTPSAAWDSVRDFFANRREALPAALRQEFLEMQIGLYGDGPSDPPRPLDPAEKLQRLEQLLWRSMSPR